MTTDCQMAAMYAAQQEVIAALYGIGEPDLAGRLERCLTARRGRHHGDGWPFVCRSAACVWCRRPMMRGWWNGMRQWTAAASMWSLAIIRMDSSEELRNGVRRLRRGLRDVRDRMARRQRQWREVCFSGMAGDDHMALVLITHEGISRSEVQNVLSHRWPDVVVKSLGHEEPTVAMLPGGAADLGRCRRGVEPLRVVVMRQYDGQVTSPIVEPMPMLV